MRGVLLAFVVLAQAAPQPPQFRAAVERIVVDVQVVDQQGRPLDTLTAADFEVRLDQHPRTVASAEFIRAAAIDTPAGGAAAASPGKPVWVANEGGLGGRDFILAVDESSFQTSDAPAVMRAARAFVHHLGENDRVGLFTYPASPRLFALTPDHTAVSMELARVVGTMQHPMSQFHLSTSEVLDLVAGDKDLIRTIAQRECLPQAAYQMICIKGIPEEANRIAAEYESLTSVSTNGLRMLLNALDQVPTRKTVVVISGGLLAADRIGARPDISQRIDMLSLDAARANATLYVLHMDATFFHSFSAADAGRNAVGAPRSAMRESAAFRSGLERLAGAIGGAMIRVEPGGEDRAFQRLLRETSAHYELAVEPLEEDRDGRMHYISVKANVRGVEVRARRTVIIPARPGISARPPY
jgi:VWFA-related protein